MRSAKRSPWWRPAPLPRLQACRLLRLHHARVLRGLCDRHMQAEKSEAMLMLCESMSVLRDAMYTYAEKIPADEFKRVSIDELPLLRHFICTMAFGNLHWGPIEECQKAD